MPLDPALSRIPGLGGYLAMQDYNQGQQLGQLQQLGAVNTLRQAMEGQQQEAATRRALEESGGDSEKAMAALIRTGNIAGAQKLAPVAKMQMEARERDETRRAVGEINALDTPPAPGMNPAQANANRVATLKKLAAAYANNPVVAQRINSEIDRLSKSENKVRTYQDGEDKVTEELQPDGTWKQIGRGPAFAKSVAPVINNTQPQPVTPVTIQDPDNPNETLVIDGRTRQVLGKGPKMTETGRMEVGQQFKMRGLGAAIQEAEDLLTGVRRDEQGNVSRGDLPTQSGIGALADKTAGFFGATLPGGQEAQRLKVIAGILTSKVPRMEGPQSDKDVELYKQSAGDAGNESLPIPRRLEAIRQMKRLYGKYERLNQGNDANPAGGASAKGAIRLRFDAQGNPIQ